MTDEQGELFPLPDPCIQVCESGPKGYCLGCLRTREERFNWPQKSNTEKNMILRRLVLRKKRAQQSALNIQKPSPKPEQQDQQLTLPGFKSTD